MREGDVEIETEKVHHIAVKQAIREVPANSGDEQGNRDATEFAREHAFAIEPGDQTHCRKCDGTEDIVGVGSAIEITKGDAGVVNVVKGEEVGNDLFTIATQREVFYDPLFRDLIEHVERKTDEEKEAEHGGRGRF